MTVRVPIADLRARLLAHLKRVRDGEEIIVLHRNVPIARIIPIDVASVRADDDLRALVAEGRARVPHDAPDWSAIDRMPMPRVRGDALLDALLRDRDEG